MSYSSRQFYQDYRYSLEKDFLTSLGERFPYAEHGGYRRWGDELRKLTFEDRQPNVAAVSDDGKYLAIGLQHEIHVVETETLSVQQVLRGHDSRVDALAFQPGDSDTLVSAAMNVYAGSAPTKPTIIFWNLKDQASKVDLAGDADTVAALSITAAQAVESKLTAVSLNKTEQTAISNAFNPIISQALANHNIINYPRLHGRLVTLFQSKPLSPSGKWMLYLPGDRPHSNDKDDRWTIKIYSTADHKDLATLAGHTDSVVWTGFNVDETLIGSVSWDKTVRIWMWSPENGLDLTGISASEPLLKFKFETSGQNWTGGFSPDSRFFAATCGDGTIHVYNLIDGTTLFTHDSGKRWCRALDWHLDGSRNLLCVGGGPGGKLLLFDIETQAVIQERKLGVDRARNINEQRRRFMPRMLETGVVRFMDRGRKVVVFTSGDGSAEVYDLVGERKWRFAREGVDQDLRTEKTTNEEGDNFVTSIAGFRMEIWEDLKKQQIMLATIDGDAVRIWAVPMTLD
ncbi:uncharacterized protein Z518_10926 [Rhinocladiella mackenziei CBS 650.93]|uniref:Anaphase-promoting complex subunit 4 WD40 domain-containing protein n=1 Tax=Rhinocladiella mackenziei CBS 650.93 TaxID=1442369 RepID=A0A0D2I2Q4_9EURO|nr:uncharacterized protein Z518_10926 [Rhinocladiella mackenziei CBS 650.93]KIW99998.1 hypothetical protein Z518_10926 [Rhinocladiella mackenziei CBS 650.93]